MSKKEQYNSLMGKAVAFVLAISVILGFIFWKFAPNIFNRVKENGPVTLTIWDINDNSSLRVAIQAYEKLHPNISINLNRQSPINYRKRVQTKIGESQGPDIFAIHNSWLGMFLQGSFAAEAPSSVITFDEFASTFYPVAVDSFTKDKKIYALPLEIDGLSLYYNDDLLKAAGVNIPVYWSDLIEGATKMTVKDQAGVIQTSGVAIGATNNVDYWSDILGLLLLQQPGIKIDSPATPLGADVLSFYTSFITDPKRKTWDVTLENSTQAFAEGKLAYLFATASKVNQIKQANPNLSFKVAPVPQLPGNTPVSWASFWGYGVSPTSPNQEEAWKFLKYLTSAQVEKTLYQEAIKTQTIGKPYSRVDLQNELLTDSYSGAFVAQGKYYKFWYLASDTGDGGLNDEMIANFQGAVNGVIGQNQNPLSALQGISGNIGPIIDKYTKIAPPPSK